MSRAAQPVIVHVVNTLEGGGTERSLLSLLHRFDPNRFRHVLITLREPGALAKDLPDHVACCPLGCVGRSRRAWLRLAGLMHRFCVDVVHARNTGCWMDTALAAFLRPRCRSVLGFHGLDSGSCFGRRHRLVARVTRCLGARFSSVAYSGALALQTQLGVPKRRIDVLVNGVDRCRFRPATNATRMALKRSLGCAHGDFVLGMVGALVPVKGHELVLRAVKRLVDAGRCVRLVLVGDGPLRDTLTRAICRAGLERRVFLVGRRSDVADWLAGLDGYVCASVSEGMSNALLEAMAARLPIVATDVGDNRFLLQGEAGLVIPPGNEAAMVAALARLMDDSNGRARMARRAGERCVDFDLRRAAAGYENFYARLLDHPIVPVSESARTIDGAGRDRGTGLPAGSHQKILVGGCRC
ncbi:MAG: glycosyltransferase [Phycisphaerae bacterium]